MGVGSVEGYLFTGISELDSVKNSVVRNDLF
ncbi:hypothetical protein AYI68_g7027, partial [Smittium mucronatum]